MRSARRFRILIADDSEVFRRGIRPSIEACGWQVCGEATDGQEAVQLYKTLEPDVVLMDLTMPFVGGLSATEKITEAAPGAKVLLFTMHDVGHLAAAAKRSRARGLLRKGSGIPELMKALRTIIAGKTYFEQSAIVAR